MQQVMLLVGPALQPAGPTASVTSTSSWIPSTRNCNPELFHGDLNKCRGFLQCFDRNDFHKVSNLLGLLQGKALAWVEAVSSHSRLETMSYIELERSFKAVFNHLDHFGDVSTRLLSLCQGNLSVEDFSVEFWTLVADSGWNEPSLRGVFLQGLSECLQD